MTNERCLKGFWPPEAKVQIWVKQKTAAAVFFGLYYFFFKRI